jgi:hypothetical protein
MSNDQEKGNRRSSGHSRDIRGDGEGDQEAAQQEERQQPLDRRRQLQPLDGWSAPLKTRPPRDISVGAHPAAPY